MLQYIRAFIVFSTVCTVVCCRGKDHKVAVAVNSDGVKGTEHAETISFKPLEGKQYEYTTVGRTDISQTVNGQEIQSSTEANIKTTLEIKRDSAGNFNLTI